MMYRQLPFATLTACIVLSAPVHALDIGLEAAVRVESSDNVEGTVVGTEEDGQLGFALLGVFGEQRGRIFQAGFSGELETRRTLSDEDGDPTTLNSFFGAANVQLSPTFSWYFGNVLGTVQTTDEILSFEDGDTERRNVFVTGPSFNFDVSSVTAISAEILYINQNQNDVDLAQLVTARLGWRQAAGGGNTYGINIDDIYTDEPELDDGSQLNSDTNRLSVSAFWERSRGLLTLFGSLGGTRFQTDEDGVNGLNAEFRLSRRLGPQTDLTFSIGTDLTDENIATIDSLLDDGTGLVPEAAGIFQSNNISLVYGTTSRFNSFEVGIRGSMSEFQVLEDPTGLEDPTLDDNVTVSLFGVLSRRLASRLNFDFGIEFENQRFSNLDDEVDSIRASALLGYQINQSFVISGGLRTTRSEGINTRENISLEADGSFETIENRLLVELRWAPPSRASQEPVVQLKQLLR